jgi:hypothetical protein
MHSAWTNEPVTSFSNSIRETITDGWLKSGLQVKFILLLVHRDETTAKRDCESNSWTKQYCHVSGMTVIVILIEFTWLSNMQLYRDYSWPVAALHSLVFLATVFTSPLVTASNGGVPFSLVTRNVPVPPLQQLWTNYDYSHNRSYCWLLIVGTNFTEKTASNSICVRALPNDPPIFFAYYQSCCLSMAVVSLFVTVLKCLLIAVQIIDECDTAGYTSNMIAYVHRTNRTFHLH